MAESHAPEDYGNAAARRTLSAAMRRAAQQGLRPVRERRRFSEAMTRGSNGGGDPYDHGPGMPRGKWSARRSTYDPRELTRDTSSLALSRGWSGKLAAAIIVQRYEQIVGPQIAQNSTIEVTERGEVIIRATSHAWAQQLMLLTPQIEQKIEEEMRTGPAAPLLTQGALSASVKVMGPRQPSQRRRR